MMVSADYYVDGISRKDHHMSASSDNLYMAPRPEQAAAVLDFLEKNADLFQQDKLSDSFGSHDYNGGKNAIDFVHGHDETKNFTAVMKEGRDVGAHIDGQYLVVFSRPHHVRRVKFVEVAFIRPVSLPASAARSRGPGPSKALLVMGSMLETL